MELEEGANKNRNNIYLAKITAGNSSAASSDEMIVSPQGIHTKTEISRQVAEMSDEDVSTDL